MKSKITLIFAALMLAVTHVNYAQQKTISGNVTDDLNLPLPGVNIIVKGTSVGTQTDFDGNYSILVSVGQTLTFSYVGFATQEFDITPTTSTLNVTLKEDTEMLGEVVVTALGIRREKRALGFGQTSVGSEAISQRPDADVSRILQGKVAGVGISQSGVAGGETNITIRDKSLINGSNSPLIVVDGVPFNAGSDRSESFAGAGATSSNRLLDIDPENIAEISVLKGLAATSLYGNQGVSGVILITTKSGSMAAPEASKLQMSVTSNTYFTTIANLPNFQNSYGSGYYLGNLNSANGSWGPEFDGELVPHILSNNSALQSSFPQFFGEENYVPYVAVPNNVKDFFRTGVGQTISVNASKATETVSINASFSNTEEEGFIPFNTLRRNTFSLGGTTKLDNNFTLSSSFNYTGTNVKAPPISAANGASAYSIFERLMYIPRNYDLMNLPYQDPLTGANVFYLPGEENPLWALHNSRSDQDVSRFYNNIALSYQINDNLSLMYRLGLDTYNDNQSFYVNRGSSLGGPIATGYLRQVSIRRAQWDHSLIMNGNFKLSESIGLTTTIGANSNRRTFSRTGTSFSDQIVFGFTNARNFATASADDPYIGILDNGYEYNIIGLFGQAEFDLNNYLYLTLSARNDWASTLESDYNSQFYPAASVSFVPTSTFQGMRSDFLSYLKLRGNIASGAQFPEFPYVTRPTLGIDVNAFDGSVSQTVVDRLPNPNLKAALITDYEVGLESMFWKNRITLNVSAYNRVAKDQIVDRPLDPSTGYTTTSTNIARVDTKGLEVEFNITPLQSENFRWDINTNFFTYETKVVSLGGDVDQFPIAGFTNLGNFAIEGEPLGVIVGSYAIRDPDTGQLLINPSTGEVISNTSMVGEGFANKIIGDPNPDWTATLMNSFTYKGFRLGAQLEYRHGGDIYSLTARNLQFRGVVDIPGYENRSDFYAGVVPGVLAEIDENGNFTGNAQLDGNGNPIQNTILLPIEDVIFNNVDSNDAENIYDGTTIRLREVSLNYELPRALLERTPFGAVNFGIFGQNLWYKAVNFPDNLNFDPETLSAGGVASGLDFQTAPSSKRIGFSVKVSF